MCIILTLYIHVCTYTYTCIYTVHYQLAGSKHVHVHSELVVYMYMYTMYMIFTDYCSLNPQTNYKDYMICPSLCSYMYVVMLWGACFSLLTYCI